MKDTPNNNDFLLHTLETLLLNSPDLIFVKNRDLTYVTSSKTFLKMVHMNSTDELIGKTDYDFFEPKLALQYTEDDKNVLETGISIVDFIEPLPDKDGKKSYSSTSKHAIWDSQGNVIGIYGIGRDVTAKIELQEEILKRQQLKHKAETDALTGLLNRESTFSHIIECLEGVGSAHTHALLFIDLDCFKQVNDNLGHLYGDQVLKLAAERLKSLFRTSDVVGRVGGDEFLVLIKNVTSDESTFTKAQEIIQSVSIPCTQVGHRIPDEYEIAITCSVGISMYRGDGKKLDQLYQEADAAMYRAKENGRNRVVMA